jgi:hypothetical protein
VTDNDIEKFSSNGTRNVAFSENQNNGEDLGNLIPLDDGSGRVWFAASGDFSLINPLYFLRNGSYLTFYRMAIQSLRWTSARLPLKIKIGVSKKLFLE